MKPVLIFGIIGVVIIGLGIVVFSGTMEDDVKKSDVNDNFQNETSKNEFQRDREWITSGPFQIDRSQYYLGENIFIRIMGLNPDDAGQIAFLRPLNETHYSVYTTIKFDGSLKPDFNQYFKPDLSRARGICSVDELIGSWRVVFQGTSYKNLSFEIINKTMPGEERMYSPIC